MNVAESILVGGHYVRPILYAICLLAFATSAALPSPVELSGDADQVRPTAESYLEDLIRATLGDVAPTVSPIEVPRLHVHWSAEIPAHVNGRALLILLKRTVWTAPSGLSYDLSRTHVTQDAPRDATFDYDEPNPFTALPFAGVGCDPRLGHPVNRPRIKLVR